MITVGEVVAALERFAPPALAADWDNVGLLLGERSAGVSRIMTCLTVTPESAAEAVERGASLVVTHHPVLFRAVKRLSSDTAEGRLLLPLLRAGVAVASPHTSFDNCVGGINDQLAGLLGLEAVRPLRPGAAPRQVKLVVFVPEADLGRVQEALFRAGAGRIGAYSECGFRLPGTGTFFGSDAANPAVGQKGRREEVAEYRLEVVCAERDLPGAVAALRAAHSYEEPAFDVYPLQPAQAVTGQAGRAGEGRLGELPARVSLADLAGRVRAGLGCGPVQVVGEAGRGVRRVAIVCGAGGELLADVARARADVFLTGEMRYHDYLTARSQGVALLLPGHHATERPGVEALARRLAGEWPGVEVWASASEVDPVTWV